MKKVKSMKSMTDIKTCAKENGKEYETRWSILVKPHKLTDDQFCELCEFLEKQGWDFVHMNNN